MPHCIINVVNTHKHIKTSSDVYIGRGSVLGNPYTHLPLEKSKAEHQVATREEAIEKYKQWLDLNILNMEEKITNELNKILHMSQDGGFNLVCFCKPKSCHGDYIKQLIEEHIKNNLVF